ncbi:MAG: hypothetical protein HPM95_18865 [Alphaproteobacteria bacterium]|nr:hypothetical protein [Alphaproteobacteria bacterium]
MLNTYAPKEAFWLTLNNEAGEIVAVIAARLNDLGSQPLTRHLEAYWTRCYRSEGGHPVAVRRQDDLFSDAITGRIVYLGSCSFPCTGAAAIFSSAVPIGQVVAFNLFEPDYLYAWMRPVHIERVCILDGVQRGAPPRDPLGERACSIDNDLAIVGNSAREGYRMIRLISEGFL